ncbi:MAG: tetratricopeptide repeat protein, partial [Deltaproteobacteria bacterium]
MKVFGRYGALVLVLATAHPAAVAQQLARPSSDTAFDDAGLAPVLSDGATYDIRHLRSLVIEIEKLYSDGAYHAAAVLGGATRLALPDSRDGEAMELKHRLEFLVGSAAAATGALATAQRLLLSQISSASNGFRLLVAKKYLQIALANERYELFLKPLTGITLDGPLLSELGYVKARALLALGYRKQALGALEQIDPQSPYFAASRYLLGLLSLEDGNVEAALDHFCRIAGDGDPDSIDYMPSEHFEQLLEQSWLALARIYHDARDWSRALQFYGRIPKDSPNFHQARYESAWCYYRLGKHSEAMAALYDSGYNQPGMQQWVQAKLLEGYILLDTCHFDEAEKIFSSLAESISGKSPAPSRSTKSKLPEVNRLLLESVPADETLLRASSLTRVLAVTRVRIAWLIDRVERLLAERESASQRKRAIALLMRNETLEGCIKGLMDRTVRALQLVTDPRQRQRLLEVKKRLEVLSGLAGSIEKKVVHGIWAYPVSVPQGLFGQLKTFAPLLKKLSVRSRNLGSRLEKITQALRPIEARRRARHYEKASTLAGKWWRLAMIGTMDAALGRKQLLESELENLAEGRYPLGIYRQLSRVGKVPDDFEYWPFD